MHETPHFTPVSELLSTAPQLTAADMAAVARAGFKAVINNRPDHEGGPDQPTAETLRQAAEAVGLAYVHQPVSPSHVRPQDVERFAAHVLALPQPVVAFCRTGTRSRRLHDSAREMLRGAAR